MELNTDFMSEILVKLGAKQNNRLQTLKNGIVIYPNNYFCRPGLKNNYAVHHFTGS